MIKNKKLLLTGMAATLIAAAGCGSSASSGAASSGGGAKSTGGKTYTVGVLTDVTGPASSGNKSSVKGVKAGTYLASRNGYTIKYEVGDTASNPATTLAAAQKLVTQKHVIAVVAVSSLTFAASSYLTAHRVPVIGAGEDASEWITSKNMFSVFGALHTTKVATTTGKFLKARGVTNLAAIGYSISPISSEAAKAQAESARAAGIKVGYLNAAFPFGSTNVAPIVLAMKKAGTDGFVATIDPNTAFALITGLRQAGVNIKAAFLPTGYGGDLLQAGPGALNAAQNVYFSLGYEPVEMGTAATKQFASDLKSAGVNEDPTHAEYDAYASVGLLVQALKAAGTSPTSASVITALSNIHDFNALGLFGSHKLDINDRDNLVVGVDNCLWVTKLQGKTFTQVPGADPVCGEVVPGKTVSPSS